MSEIEREKEDREQAEGVDNDINMRNRVQASHTQVPQ